MAISFKKSRRFMSTPWLVALRYFLPALFTLLFTFLFTLFFMLLFTLKHHNTAFDVVTCIYTTLTTTCYIIFHDGEHATVSLAQIVSPRNRFY